MMGETRWNYRRMLDKPFFGMVEETVIGFSRNGHERTSSLVSAYTYSIILFGYNG